MTETTTIIVFWELCCLIHNMKHQSPLLQVKIYCSIYKKNLHKNKWKQDIMLEFFYIMIMFTGIFFGSWQSDKKQDLFTEYHIASNFPSAKIIYRPFPCHTWLDKKWTISYHIHNIIGGVCLYTYLFWIPNLLRPAYILIPSIIYSLHNLVPAFISLL